MSIAAVKPDQGTRVLSYAGALLETMDAALADHANVFIMGQGVDDFKGIFGSTTGLAEKYGARTSLVAGGLICAVAAVGSTNVWL